MSDFSKTINVQGRKVNLVDEGQGDPILFVHGFPLNHAMWSHQIHEFSRTHRVIAPDLPGFGGSESLRGSEPVPTPLTMVELADWLVKLLQKIGEEKPVIFCGLSMGGYIGWQFAARHRARLARLVACNTRAAADSEVIRRARKIAAMEVMKSGTGPVAKAMIPKLFGSVRLGIVGLDADKKTAIAQTEAAIRETNPETVAAGHLGMGERPDMRQSLLTLDVPTLFIAGGHDEITPASEMETDASFVTHSKFVCAVDAAHMVPLEAPQDLNGSLREFVG